MTQAFAKYLNTEPDLAKSLWIELYSRSDKDCCVTVNITQLAELRKVSEGTIKTILFAKGIKRLVLIVSTGEIVSACFKTTSRYRTRLNYKHEQAIEGLGLKLPEAPPAQLPEVDTADNLQVVVPEIIPVMETIPVKVEVAPVPVLMATELPAVAEKKAPAFKFSYDLQKATIADYITFFQSLQVRKASMVGVPSKLMAPKITGIEVKFLRLISVYFHSIGAKTDKEIVFLFRRMYNAWEDLDDYLQKGVAPHQIYHNINNIVECLTRVKQEKIQKTKQELRDEQYHSKKVSAGTRDYGKLTRGEKGNS